MMKTDFLLYRVSTLKVEHRQLTLCIQFIDIIIRNSKFKRHDKVTLHLEVKLPFGSKIDTS
jgi:hypothetical protein